MKATIAALLVSAAAVSFLGCRPAPTVTKQTIIIPDVTRRIVLDLTPTNRDMVSVSTVWMHYQGEIDGMAFFVPLAGDTQTISGVVNTQWGGDVSTGDKYLLEYIPGTVKKGSLSVTYLLR